ncbi:restriction endonuclease subunit S [Lactococcus garvieae]|nr:restriction endonuclease subunit S [Lactococcus garvieae]NHJ06671.1 restriction endonuclease subunit S [Lactococcus garvieae]
MELLNLIQGTDVDWKELNDCVSIITAPSKLTKKFYQESGTIPIVDQGEKFVAGYTDGDYKTVRADEYVIFGDHSEHIKFIDFEFIQGADGLKILKAKGEILPKYLYHTFKNFYQKEQSYKRHWSSAKETKIPIPSLEIQQKVVEILDKMTDYVTELTAELTLRQKQYSYYRDQLLTFDLEDSPLSDSGESLTVRWMMLGEIATIIAGGDLPENYSKGQTEPSSEFPYPIYSNGTGVQSLYGFTDDFRVDSEAITISARGTLGWHTIREPKFTPIVRLLTLIPNTEIISTKFLNYVLTQVKLGGVKTGIPSLTKPMIEKVSIPVPPLKFQSKIVEILDKFQALIEDISGLLPEEIASRQKQYEYWREQLLSFKRE